jgi:tryptophan synthase alpha chain
MNGIQRIQIGFEHHKAFVGYLTAGDGGIKRTLAASLALIAGGVNLLEIGMPFSDPIADGPVIQRASTRALASGTTLQDVLWLIEQIRKVSDIPLVLFSYLNPLLAVLKSSFFQDAKHAGMDGMLIVDCPIEESQDIHQHCMAMNMALVYVVTPSTSLARMRQIDQQGAGFLYYACRKGTTGVRSSLPHDFSETLQRIKSIVNLPVVAGFGISTPLMAKEALRDADGVVVGSLFVKALEEGMPFDELTRLARNIYPRENEW